MRGTILVTGGAGYVGSHVTRELVDRGADVVVFDNLQTGWRQALPPEARFIEGDLADAAALDRLFSGRPIAAVMHFAANSLVGNSMRDPFPYLGDNVSNAVSLVKAMAKHEVRKMVFSSTASLYGQAGETAIDEAAEIAPDSPYGESKYQVERMLGWAERIFGIRSACLRYFNAAGAHPGGRIGEDHRPETHLIPLALQVAEGQRPDLTIFGDDYATPDGTCIRDYVHVCDLADAHLRVLDVVDRQSCCYNLGTGHGYSVREVVAAVAQVTGRPCPATVGPRRAGDPPMLVAASGKIRRELGWTPRFDDLQEIIGSAWQWRQNFPRGYAE